MTNESTFVVVMITIALAVIFIRVTRHQLEAGAATEPTEWMRRGGLMESPSATAHPDDVKIRAALAALPDDFPARARDEVEAYLAMSDSDEKQLVRDRLIRDYYEQAGKPEIAFAQARAYNALRLALSPWAEEDEEA